MGSRARRSLRALHWKEALHPRDDRGRFAHKGGQKWAGRVLREAHAGFADIRAHDAGHDIRAGRRPGGVIDTKLLSDQGRRAGLTLEARKALGGGKYVDFNKARDYGQVKVGEDWYTINGHGFEHGKNYISWRNDQGDKRGRITEDAGSLLVRHRPAMVPGAALPAGGEREARMRGWEADAKKEPPFKLLTNHEVYVRRNQADVDKAKAALDEAVRKAKARARRKYPTKEGYGKYTRDNYVEDETFRERHDLTIAEHRLNLALKDHAPEDDRVHTTSLPELVGQPDPSRPLSVYGNMLHAKAYDEASFKPLAELEQIPFGFHKVVAGAMVVSRHRPKLSGGDSEPSGIYVGNGSIADLLPIHFGGGAAGEQPRGWGEGRTFHDVNGGFIPSVYALVVGHTANSGGGHTHTAAPHEFGHALDFSLGFHEGRPGGPVSHAHDWRAIHRRVLADHGPGLSPYFQQPGSAGAEEFWAEAFDTWVIAYRNALATEKDAPSSAKDFGRTTSEEFVRNRVNRALVRQFDINNNQATEISNYFQALADELGVQW